MNKLKVENIRKLYKEKRGKKVVALEDVSFDIKKDELIAVLGRETSGKTTLLRIIAGLEKPDTGLVYIDEKPINLKAPSLGIVSYASNKSGLYPYMNIRKNIDFSLKTKKVPLPKRKELIEKVAKTLEIEDYLDLMPKDITMGLKSRVNAAKAMACRPKVLIFDDVFRNGHDRMSQGRLKWMENLHKKEKSTILFSTSKPVEALMIATKIVILKDGMVEQYGSPGEICNEPASEYVREIMRQ